SLPFPTRRSSDLLFVERLRVQHRTAALLRTAPARVQCELFGVVRALPGELVVVPELLARFAVPNRVDVDPAILDHGLAVRRATVIDATCLVPVDARVDHGAAARDEQKRVSIVILFPRVASVGFVVSDALTQVFDDAGALLDRRDRIDARTVDFRMPGLD